MRLTSLVWAWMRLLRYRTSSRSSRCRRAGMSRPPLWQSRCGQNPLLQLRLEMMPVAIRAQETEIDVRAYRRRFSAAYKLRILAEADACTEPGAMGALLGRDGLYSSHLAT